MNRLPENEYRGNELVSTWPAPIGTQEERAKVAVLSSRDAVTPSLLAESAAFGSVYGPFEAVALGYLAVSSALIVIFRVNLAHPWRLLSVQALVAVLILAVCRAEANVWTGSANRSGESVRNGTLTQRFWHFWRHWYPHLFFLFCFEELGALVHLVSPRWQDGKLIALDYWLTGVHPAIWLEQFATPGRNEFMQFAYLTYFVYLLVLGGILYYREDWRGYWSVMTYSSAAYAIGYVIAIFFPIESPWFAMAGSWHAELQGGPFTVTINFIEHFGRVRGAAFPSEHVAGSVAAMWGAWRHRRWLFWVMLPLVICMCASTVWGRYHYLVDVFGGVVTGTLGYLIGARLMKKAAQGGTAVRPREYTLPPVLRKCSF